MREVEYVADKHGFRAIIKTNEPGTAPKDPAYVKMHSNPVHVEYKPEYKSKEYHPEPQEHYGGHQAHQGYKKESKYEDAYKAASSPAAMGGALGGLQDAYDDEYAVVGTNNHAQQALTATIGAMSGAKYGAHKQEVKPKYQDKRK